MIELAIIITMLSANWPFGEIYELVPVDMYRLTNYNAVLSAEKLRKDIIFNTNNFIKYSSYIDREAKRYSLDPDLVMAVIVIESKFNPKAGSHKGAQGLMQLMSPTAREVGVSDRLDPYDNIQGGVKYLGKMVKRFKGNIPLALAAYNAGPGRVLKYKGIPPFKETQGYIKKVLSARDTLRLS